MTPAPPISGSGVAPTGTLSAAALSELLALASTGNIVTFRRLLADLRARHAEALLSELETLATDYQMARIRSRLQAAIASAAFRS